jgi:hypothetical protein
MAEPRTEAGKWTVCAWQRVRQLGGRGLQSSGVMYVPAQLLQCLAVAGAAANSIAQAEPLVVGAEALRKVRTLAYPALHRIPWSSELDPVGPAERDFRFARIVAAAGKSEGSRCV